MTASKNKTIELVAQELFHHIPFTALGAVTGVIIMVLITIYNLPQSISNTLFYTLHPAHVVLSAIVTTAICCKYGRRGLLPKIIIGYTGAVGIATISDAVMPYIAGKILGIPMEFHLPFIETIPFFGTVIPEWVAINVAALIGIAVGYLKPGTRFPHATHVLLSTWATLFNFTAFGAAKWTSVIIPIFFFLFISVWLPCCFSDIVYPLLWGVKEHED